MDYQHRWADRLIGRYNTGERIVHGMCTNKVANHEQNLVNKREIKRNIKNIKVNKLLLICTVLTEVLKG